MSVKTFTPFIANFFCIVDIFFGLFFFYVVPKKLLTFFYVVPKNSDISGQADLEI